MCTDDGFASGWEFKLEEQLNDGERHRLTQLLDRADAALQPPRQPAWWLAP